VAKKNQQSVKFTKSSQFFENMEVIVFVDWTNILEKQRSQKETNWSSCRPHQETELQALKSAFLYYVENLFIFECDSMY